MPDVPVTRLWLEVQPGISALFAFRCGIYVCLMSRCPLCLHIVPQVCAESEACGCEWVTDVHRSSRRVSCFKCFTFYLKDVFKSLTGVSKKLKFREVQLKNIIMSNLLWFSVAYNIWWVCLLQRGAVLCLVLTLHVAILIITVTLDMRWTDFEMPMRKTDLWESPLLIKSLLYFYFYTELLFSDSYTPHLSVCLWVSARIWLVAASFQRIYTSSWSVSSLCSKV